MSPSGRDRLGGNLLQILGTFCWASTFPATALLLQTWHPLLAAVARIGGGALVLMTFLVVTGRIARLGPLPWRRLTVLGIVGFGLAGSLVVAGQASADPVTAAVIATTIPLISAIMGLFEGTERLRPHLVLGVVLAVAGGVIVSLAGFSGPLAVQGFGGGEILVLGSMIGWTWFSRRAIRDLPGLDSIARAALPMSIGAVALAVVTGGLVAIGLVEPRWRPDATSLGLIAWIATGGIGLSVVLWLVSSRILGVTIASMHANLAPFYVMILALAAGGAVLTGQILGALLVIAGALVAQLGGSGLRSILRPALRP